jgi:hypothetical protein
MSFDRFGIKHLSPSSLNAWRAEPGLWALKYLAGYREESGGAIWRGNAVENGMNVWLRLKDEALAVKTAVENFETNALGLADDETEAERARVVPTLKAAINAIRDETSPLIAAQMKVGLLVDGVQVPVIGYLDFLFENGRVRDLKTAKAMPPNGEPRPEHARQVALYVRSRREEGKECTGELHYATDKKSALLPVENVDELIEELAEDARSLQAFLSKAESPADALAMLPMPKDSFKWKPETTEFLARMRAA